MAKALVVRALFIGGIAVAVLFPIHLIDGKIRERRARAEGVVAQFAAETTGPQVISGPFLALTCEETYVEERQVMRSGKAETIAEKKTAPCPTGYFPPRALRVAGTLPVESRYRGIYPVRLYRATLDLGGEIVWPAPAAPNGTNPRTWKKAYLVLGISDPRGIKAVSASHSPDVGRIGDEDIRRQFAVSEELGDPGSRKEGAILPFGYRLQLTGTSSVHVAPVGDATEIRLKSDWPHPSFSGGWSPDERRIDRSGFEAAWRTTHLATGGRAFWEKAAHDGHLLAPGRAAGLAFFDPVNVYSLSHRATEYAFLFILFTFAALALVEMLAEVRLHAVQYLLVGSALAVFFLLLLAVSEHASFATAYVTASGACVALLTIYLRHPLGSSARGAAFAALFATLYGALYVLLMREDDALLLGSLRVFALLAAVMIGTRKVQWSEVARRMAGPTGGAVSVRAG